MLKWGGVVLQTPPLFIADKENYIKFKVSMNPCRFNILSWINPLFSKLANLGLITKNTNIY